MKNKLLSVISIFLMMIFFTACTSDTKVEKVINEQMAEQTVEPVDVIDTDLTVLSSTMVYSEVYNIMTHPDDYRDKTIKMKGLFSVYENEDTGAVYFACIIQDATACCAQGIEFVLEGDYYYPEDYPEMGTEITVQGEFETYEEDGISYCRLRNAKML